MKLLEAQNLTKKFMMGQTEVQALKGVSVGIEKGEFIAITGSSGSGKSTLMQLLGCLDVPTSGSYVLDGTDVAQSTSNQLAFIRNKKIGFVFQKFNLLSDLTARENVMLPCLYGNMAETEASSVAATMLEAVQLQDRIDHYPYQLSGGQQQRVAIARALANNPEIIFADEPTGNLDTATGQIVLDIFKELNKNKNVTVVLITHEADVAAQARRIIELKDGLIITDKVV
jgi:putative ABC transport system ATP-binding protein